MSSKIGVVFLVLGFMHFFNLLVFAKLRRRNQPVASTPPDLPGYRSAKI